MAMEVAVGNGAPCTLDDTEGISVVASGVVEEDATPNEAVGDICGIGLV